MVFCLILALSDGRDTLFRHVKGDYYNNGFCDHATMYRVKGGIVCGCVSGGLYTPGAR